MNRPTPTVSIVIPTYNRAADLERALASVLGQSFQDFEVIIVDNHSTDATADLIRQLNDARIQLVLIHNQGIIAKSRNRGLDLAKGRFIAFLDSDDWWQRHKLQRSVAALEGGADLVYHDLYYVRQARQRLFLKTNPQRQLKPPYFDDLLTQGNAFFTSSLVVRRALLDPDIRFLEDPALNASEDFELWLRLAQKAGQVTKLPQPLGYYWVGGGNTSSSERTLRSFDHLARLYPALQADPPVIGGWYAYSRGVAYFRLKQKAEAQKSFRQVVKNRQAGFIVRLKALVYLVKLILLQ